MSIQSISQRWTDWAGDHEDNKSTFARRIAAEILIPENLPIWSQIDLSREIDRLNSGPTRFSSIMNVVQSLSYVVPIGLTWFHLRSAIIGYRDVPAIEGRSIDFLQFWSGANNLYTGVTLPNAALQVLIAVLAIALLQFYDLVENNRTVPSELLLDTQIELLRHRVVTPRELADTMSTAATELGAALAAARDTLTGLQDTAHSISTSISGLATATENLKLVTEPMRILPQSLNEVVLNLNEVDRLSRDTVREFSEVARQSTHINRANFETIEKTKELVDSIHQMTGAAQQIGSLAQDVSKIVRGISLDLDDHQPHIVAVRESAQLFQATTEELRKLFNEFHRSSEMYRELVEQDRHLGRS